MTSDPLNLSDLPPMTNAERSRAERKEQEARVRSTILRSLGWRNSPVSTKDLHKRCFPASGEQAYGWEATLARLREMAAAGDVVETPDGWTTPKKVPAKKPAPVDSRPVAADPELDSGPLDPAALSLRVLAAASKVRSVNADDGETVSPAGRLAGMVGAALNRLREGPCGAVVVAQAIGAKREDWRAVADVLFAQGWARREQVGKASPTLHLTDKARAMLPPHGSPVVVQEGRAELLATLVEQSPGLTPSEYRARTGWTGAQIDHAARKAVKHGSVVRVGTPPAVRYYTPGTVPGTEAAPVEEPAVGLNLHDLNLRASPEQVPAPDPAPAPPVEVDRHGPPAPMRGAGVAAGSMLMADGTWATSQPDPMLAGFAALADRLAKAEALLARMDALIEGASELLADHIRLRAADKQAASERFVALEAQVGVLTRSAHCTADSITSLELSHEANRSRLTDLASVASLHGEEIRVLTERSAGPHDVAAIAERLDTVETDVASFAAAREADSLRLEEAMRIVTATGERVERAALKSRPGPWLETLRISSFRELDGGGGEVILRGPLSAIRDLVWSSR